MKRNIQDKEKELNRLFEIAKQEKVDYTKEDSKKLIASYVAAGVGSTYFLKSIFNIKSITMMALAAAASLAVYKYATDNHSTEKNITKTAKNQRIETAIKETNTNKSPIEKVKETEKVKEIVKYVYINKYDSKNSKITSNNYNIKDETDEEETIPDQSASYDVNLLNESKFKSSEISLLAPVNEMREYSTVEVNALETEDRIRTIAFDWSKDNDFSVGASQNLSIFNGSLKRFSAINAAWIMNKKYSLSLQLCGSFTDQQKYDFTSDNGEKISGDLSVGYGALKFDYQFYSYSFFNAYANCAIGLGATSMRSTENQSAYKPWNLFALIEPGIVAEINLFSNIRVGAEASYKISGIISKSNRYRNDKLLDKLKPAGIGFGLTLKYYFY
jgi:hypothetical protein